MTKSNHPSDPRGLIYEAYRMDLNAQDCRTIFFDWAMGHPVAVGNAEISDMLKTYEPKHPDHPMTAVLREGLERSSTPRRRKSGSSTKRGISES